MILYLRIAYTIVLALAAFWFPWWVALIGAGVGYVLFDWYIEGVLVLVLTDLVFGVPLARWHGFTAIGTLTSALLFAFVELGKRLTRYGTA